MDFLSLRRKLIEKDFSGMNDRQFEAVTTVNGPLLVLAGAGSGKTTVLVNRIANLVKYGNAYLSNEIPFYRESDIDEANNYLEGITNTLFSSAFSLDAPRPWEILAITFTNKAANELKSRICAKLSDEGNGIWAGTFHSICGKILRTNAEYAGYTSHFTIYDTDDQKRVMKEVMKTQGIDEKMFPVKSVLSAISNAKDSLISPEEFENSAGSDYRLQKIAVLYKEYQKALKNADAMDFDDMITETVKMFNNNPEILKHYQNKFKYIMVDEYQDTNHAQYVLVNLLSRAHKNLCVVGDDDQSIYRFRGATIENILNFEDDYDSAKTIRLEQNYRSHGNILNAANRIIANNKGRKGKNLWTDKGDGELINVHTATDEREEARYVADKILENVKKGDKFSQNAVLYRMNAQSAAVENVFARSGIPYTVIGGHRFYDRKEIKDVLAYLCVINNTSDNLRLKRIINEPKRGIGDTTVNNAAAIAEGLGISLFEVFKNAEDYPTISRAASKLKEFCAMIEALREIAETESLSALLENMLEKSGYMDSLIIDTSMEAIDRKANVEEFASTVKSYENEADEPSLSGFLEEIALVTDIDALNTSEDRTVMMTIHSAKGLEFDNVFLVGLEEGIFPGMQSIYGGESEIEEERRLAYVAVTRAKKKLVITNTSSRMLYGSTTRNAPSRFLNEIPLEYRNDTADTRGSFYSGYQKSGGFNDSFSTPKPKRSAPVSFGNSSFSKPKSNSSSYVAGQTVMHNTFGKGMIIKATPMGSDTLLEIAFENVGTKKLMANFAKLKIL